MHYFDYKSPYAYLAQEGTFNIAKRDDVKMVWVPYGLKIGKYLGEAALDDAGEDTIKTRNDHQWRRVRYSYMDCRREANKKGLTLLGPKKIFDSSLSHMAFLFLSKSGNPKRFHCSVFKYSLSPLPKHGLIFDRFVLIKLAGPAVKIIFFSFSFLVKFLRLCIFF